MKKKKKEENQDEESTEYIRINYLESTLRREMAGILSVFTSVTKNMSSTLGMIMRLENTVYYDTQWAVTYYITSTVTK